MDPVVTTGLGVPEIMQLSELVVARVDEPYIRRYEYVDDSGALVQTAEVKVVHQGAELVFGLNATPDKTRHSVTVRRGQDSGPDVIHIQTNGVYHGVVDEVVETRGRLTI